MKEAQEQDPELVNCELPKEPGYPKGEQVSCKLRCTKHNWLMKEGFKLDKGFYRENLFVPIFKHRNVRDPWKAPQIPQVDLWS